jgi:hypothetical protein
VNFATELSDLRHRNGFRIVLIHDKSVPDALLACAHVHYLFGDVVKDVQERQISKVWIFLKSWLICVPLLLVSTTVNHNNSRNLYRTGGFMPFEIEKYEDALHMTWRVTPGHFPCIFFQENATDKVEIVCPAKFQILYQPNRSWLPHPDRCG